jgi:hypothetical protein
MPELFVMCPECGLRDRLAHSNQELDDPERKCKHGQKPANCSSLRTVLTASHRMLDYLEWQAKRDAASFHGNDEDVP